MRRRYDSFFGAIGSWLGKDKILTVDAGFPLIAAQNVRISEPNHFLCQAAWLSIGYSVPAATGAKAANPNKRVIVTVGDGAFHETCQAVGDHQANGQNTVVFVLSNGVYGIEQYIVNPNPYRQNEAKKDYQDPHLNSIFSYNSLPKWDFVKLAEGFGSQGRKVSTPAELHSVLQEIDADQASGYLVAVTIPPTDLPAALRQETPTSIGEDEYQNPNWPPARKF